MKFAQDAARDLTQSAQRIVAALSEAATAMSHETESVVSVVQAAVTEVPQRLGQLVSELSAMGSVLDPAPILQGLESGVAQGRGALDDVLNRAQQSGRALEEGLPQLQTQLTQGMERANQMAAGAAAQAQKRAQSAALGVARNKAESAQALKTQAEGLWRKASTALDLVSHYGQSVSQESAAEGVEAASARLAALRLECQAQIDGLEQELLQSVAALQSEMLSDRGLADPTAQPNTALDAAASGFATNGAALGAPASGSALSATLTVEPWTTAVKSATEGLAAARQALPAALARLRAPIDQAQRQVDAIPPKISSAADRAERILADVGASAEGIKAAAGRLITRLMAAVNRCREEIEAIRAMLKRWVDQALALMAKLEKLPEHFKPVRAAITTAIAQIDQIRERIPLFVAQALGALTSASGQLQQAGSLCDNAIAVCTRHMTKAPLLIPARAIFMAIKATLPAIQSAIASAKTLVQTAAGTAQSLLDQAKGLVRALEPLLDQALQQLKTALQTLVGLIRTLEQSLGTALTRLSGLTTQVETAAKSAHQQFDALAQRAAATVQTQVKTVKPATMAETLKTQLSATAQKVFPPLHKTLDASTGSVAQVLNQAEQSILKKASEIQVRLQRVQGQEQSIQAQLNARPAAGPKQEGSAPDIGIQKACEGLLLQLQQRIQAAMTTSRVQVERIHEQAMRRLDASSSAA